MIDFAPGSTSRQIAEQTGATVSSVAHELRRMFKAGEIDRGRDPENSNRWIYWRVSDPDWFIEEMGQ